MKSLKRVVSVIIILTLALSLCACSDVEKTEKETTVVEKKDYSDIKIPEIKSEDNIMPTFVDISVYDVENYADIYLGEKFKYKVTYAGSEIPVPATYKQMLEKDFKIAESDGIGEDSTVMSGKYLKVNFENEHGTRIIGYFYNSAKSSKALKKCKIVKFEVPENSLYVADSVYGDFWVNGVSNSSAITDIIEVLGAPSHFYAVSSEEYYLDYFLSEEDKRSKITVYINPTEDNVKAVEFARFE